MDKPTQLRRINADGCPQVQDRVYLVPGTKPGDLVAVGTTASEVLCRSATEHFSLQVHCSWNKKQLLEDGCFFISIIQKPTASSSL